MKYFIVGRTASGKDWFAKKLEKEMGLKQLISYTDRPRRPGEGDSHIFCDKIEHNFGRNLLEKFRIRATVNGETKEFMDSDVIASTVIDHYSYFATVGQLDAADIYIIDPDGLIDLFEFWKDYEIKEEFRVLYVSASKTEREQRYIERNHVRSFIDYLDMISRFQDEDYEFNEFEKKITDYLYIYHENIKHTDVIIVDNGHYLNQFVYKPEEAIKLLKVLDEGKFNHV